MFRLLALVELLGWIGIGCVGFTIVVQWHNLGALLLGNLLAWWAGYFSARACYMIATGCRP